VSGRFRRSRPAHAPVQRAELPALETGLDFVPGQEQHTEAAGRCGGNGGLSGPRDPHTATTTRTAGDVEVVVELNVAVLGDGSGGQPARSLPNIRRLCRILGRAGRAIPTPSGSTGTPSEETRSPWPSTAPGRARALPGGICVSLALGAATRRRGTTR